MMMMMMMVLVVVQHDAYLRNPVDTATDIVKFALRLAYVNRYFT